MGDQDDPTSLTPSFSLPPGCRFHPSDEQLVCYYLTSKNDGDRSFGFDLIKEIDLYNYDPFDLPEASCFRFGRGGRRRHWYCFMARVFKERRRRSAGSGFWKRRGRVRDIVAAGTGKVVVGTRKSFVFYLGDSTKNAVRTDWVMYEYALIDRQMASFVLCRVFANSCRGTTVSEHAVSSCGEESVATVRHVGVQHDGVVYDDNSSAHENKVVSELDDKILDDPDGQQIKSCHHLSGGTVIADTLASQQLIAILEEDFIELDDLISPLSGIADSRLFLTDESIK